RKPHRHFVSAQERSREEEIAHVGASDQEDKENDGRGDAERRRNPAGRVERCFPERKDFDATPAVCFRKIVLQPFRDRGKFRLSLLSRDAWFQKRVTFNPARAAVLHFIARVIERLLHRRRNPKVEVIAYERAVEFFW